ncbi:MAG: deoxyribonuclease IV [Candidatus Heimdallarchaeaceae archaeon]
MKIGCHVSISKSIDLCFDRAKRIGCNTFQIFTKNPRGWAMKRLQEEEIKKFKDNISRKELSPVFAHISYLPNLASQKEEILAKSRESFFKELERCVLLDIPYFVVHGGSFKGGTFQEGLKTYIDSILKGIEVCSSKVCILIENSANREKSLTGDLTNIGAILNEINDKKAVRVCFDTCHAFAAGYDLRNTTAVCEVVESLEENIGKESVCLIHANDSKGDLGSNRDLHEHIGLGKIGQKGFSLLVNNQFFRDKPWILETPVNEIRTDRENIDYLRSLEINEKKKETVLC